MHDIDILDGLAYHQVNDILDDIACHGFEEEEAIRYLSLIIDGLKEELNAIT